MGTIVYRFGLLPPTENAAVVRRQMRLAHDYRNLLVEIERGKRAALRALDAELGDTRGLEASLTAADAAVEAIYVQVRRERSKVYRCNLKAGTSLGAAKRGARV